MATAGGQAPSTDAARMRSAMLHLLEDLQKDRAGLQQARRDWLATVDAIANPLVVHDAQQRVVRCNRAYADRARMAYGEIIGRPYWECFPRRNGPLDVCPLQEEPDATAPRGAQVRLETGETWVSRHFDIGEGEDAQVLLVFEDVTDRQRLSAQARAVQDLTLSAAVFEGDLEKAARQVTEAAARVTGVARASVWLFNEAEDELRCIDLFEANKPLHSSGMALREEEFRSTFAALKQASFVDANDPLTDPRTAGYRDAYLKPLGITSQLHTLVQVSGRRIGLLCFEHVGRTYRWKRDEILFGSRLADKIAMTLSNRATHEAERALRDSERRFRSIFEHAPVGISVSSLDGSYQSVNARLCEITGYSESELLARSFRDITHPDDVGKDQLNLGRLVSGEIGEYSNRKRYLRKDGSVRWADLVVAPVRDGEGRAECLVTVAADVTAQVAAEAEIRALARFPEENPNGVLRIAADGRVLYANPASRTMRALCGTEVGGRASEDCLALVRAALNDGQVRGAEMRHGERTLAVTVAPVVAEGYANLYGVDVTERNEARRALESRERFFRKVLDGSSDAFFVVDAQARLLYRSESGKRLTGYDASDLFGRDLTAFLRPESLEVASQNLAELIRHPDETRTAELRVVREDGSVIEVEAMGRNLIADPDVQGLVVTARDITQRKAAERALRESEEKFRAIFSSTIDGIAAFNLEKRCVVFANRSMERLLGYESGQLDSIAVARLHPEGHIAAALRAFELAAQGKSTSFRDVPMRTRDGKTIYADITGGLVRIGNFTYLLGVFRDASERRAAEQSLKRTNRALRTLSAGNEAVVRATDETALLKEMARVLGETGGYSTVYIGYRLDDAAQSMETKATYGFDPAGIDPPFSWGDNARGQTASGRALRTGATQQMQTGGDDDLYQDFARARGHTAALGLPLRFAPGERPFGVVGLGAKDPSLFGDEEVKLLEELTSDLTYGIANLRTRVEREAATTRLRLSLEGTIGAIGSTMEARDPYTAGHQRRVAALAAAIASEMGLSPEQIEGIHFGAIIHDVGKIQLPAEILAKPTRLSRIEFELIKTHPQAGYDIVKDIEFPWPVALMVLQHHERLDGSGYPQGLKGEQIILEARVLAVADVVEAMSSHRPYRAGLGLEAALREIETKKGIWFDPASVDACLRLFREKNFKL